MRQVQSYRDRYGSAFPAVGEALINSAMPLCAELASWHLGLSDHEPARRVHPTETRWLEGLAKGQLESTFAQMAQHHRFGAPQAQLESILVQRIWSAAPLMALFRRMGDVQEKWLRATAPIFAARFPYQSPDKLILNVFATEWALATGLELRLRAHSASEAFRQGEKKGGKLNLETAKMRTALIDWASSVLESRWPDAMKFFGLIETRWIELDLDEGVQDRPLILDEEVERAMAGLHQAMKWAILGRWGQAFMSLFNLLYPEGEEGLEEGELEGQEERDDSLDSAGETGDQSGAREEKAPERPRSEEMMKILEHAHAAFEAIERLCAQCAPPLIAIPLQEGDLIGSRGWFLEEGMGTGLWLARGRDENLGCLEELWPLGDEAWSSQTQTDALALSGCSHTHIAPVIDWGVDPDTGRWFLAHPYVYGASLSEKVEEAPLSEAQARAFFVQIIDALKRGIKVDVLHKQLRPENVIFYSEEQLALTRWGIHRGVLPAWSTTSDHTPWRRCFIAPEVWTKGAYSNQSEVYSLGMLLAFALAPDSLLLDHEWSQLLSLIPRPSAEGSPWVDLEKLPLAYRPLIAQATHPDPAKRHETISAFESVLKEIKPLYNYRGEFGERDGLTLMEVVSMILSKPKGLHSLWRGHLKLWSPWKEVDEIEQVVSAVLLQREEETKKEAEEEEKRLEEERENESKVATPRSPRRSLVKKPSLNRGGADPQQSAPRKRPPSLNPYLLKGSIAEEPGTLHTITFEGVPLQLCYIPHGDFMMGSSGHAPTTLRLERPQHVVSIRRPFLMSQMPITQGFYAALTGYNPSYFEDWDAPVEQLSWREAAEFCNRLSALDGLPLVYHFKEEELEEDPEPEVEDEAETSLEHLVAMRKKKMEEEGLGGRSAPSPEGRESHEEERGAGQRGGEHDGDGEGEQRREQDEHASRDESQASPAQDQSGGDNELEEVSGYEFALSAELEKEPEKDEARRLILLESEAELEEKSKRRYQLHKVKEPPKPVTWVRCDLTCGGYRLPTEAEWEYAARAGSTNLLYAGSNKWSEVAWGAPPTREGTQPVGRLKKNAWGLFDLSGNVAEWCTDEQRVYTRNCVDPSQGASDHWFILDTRATRGGGWTNPKFHGRIAARDKTYFDQRRNHLGFRVVRPLLPVSPFEMHSDEEEREPSPQSEE